MTEQNRPAEPRDEPVLIHGAAVDTIAMAANVAAVAGLGVAGHMLRPKPVAQPQAQAQQTPGQSSDS